VHDSALNFRSRLIGDSLVYLPSVVIPAAVALLGVVVFTRLLGVNDFGVYSVVAAVVTILTVGGGEWIGQSILRYLPEQRDDVARRELVASSLGMSLATMLLVIALGTVFRLVVAGRSFDVLVLPVTALLAMEILFTVAGAEVQARMQARRLSLYRIAGSVARFAFALGCMLWFARSVEWLLVGAAVGRGLLALALTLDVARDANGWIRPRLDGWVVRRFASFGVPIIGWTMCSQVLGLSDRFIISAIKGNVEAGIYSASYALVAMAFQLISGPLMTAAHPLIVTAWRDRRHDVPDVVTSSSRLYLMASLPALALLVVCRRQVVELLLAAGFHEGSAVVPALAFGSVVWGLGRYGNKCLELAERTRTMFLLVLVTALANIALNLLLVPRYGYIAAAWTTLACNTLYPVLVYVAAQRHVAWRIPWTSLAPIAAASALAGLAAWLVRERLNGAAALWNLGAAVLVGLTVYGVLVWGWQRRGASR
jgi:O-antigen/teichoic acid export membrane protein